MIDPEARVCIFNSAVDPTAIPPNVAVDIDNSPNGVSFFATVGESMEEAAGRALDGLFLDASGPVAVVPAPSFLPADARTEDVMRIQTEYAKMGFRHVVVVF